MSQQLSKLFGLELLSRSLRPQTLTKIISFCATSASLDVGSTLHAIVIKLGFCSNVYIYSALVGMYGKCGKLWDAQKVFDENASQKCSYLEFFDFWLFASWFATKSNSFVSGDVKSGNRASDDVQFLWGLVGTGLVDMYSKCCKNGLVSMYARCGAIHDSKWVFTLMKEHDVVSWNSFLSGYAHHGFGRETVELFEQMRRTRVKPDNTTFLIVLTACSHVGLLDKGLEYFNIMRNDDLLEPPKMEHYATIVDLLGRAGNLHEAQAFVDSMPIEPGASVYKALLSACQVHGNKELARCYATKLQQLCPNDPATYILLSNVLLTRGYWDDAAEVRKLMYDRGIRKTPGYSWI
ncbi:hypothetical protein M0R45_005515 [Rubus argutus]|uniref:Pentatricopeptide repeat-containing protein n=1 Tax=Rubus argutus TaxID=59490 RepID=A0AAW1YN41_RUBAR